MRRLALGAALTVLAGPALAADPVVYEPAPAPVAAPTVYDWTGFYLGAQVGHGWGDHHFENAVGPFANDYDSDGWFGGAFTGYNHQFANNIILGIEGDINYANIKGDDAGVGGAVDTTEIEWFGSLRGRLGYAFDRILIFGTAGVAFGRFEHTAAGLGVADRTNHTEIGWTVGGGGEMALNEMWTVRAEYRYYDFGDYSDSDPAVIVPFSVDNTLHTVSVGVGYKF